MREKLRNMIYVLMSFEGEIQLTFLNLSEINFTSELLTLFSSKSIEYNHAWVTIIIDNFIVCLSPEGRTE